MGLEINTGGRALEWGRLNNDSVHPLQSAERSNARQRSAIVDRMIDRLNGQAMISTAVLEGTLRQTNISQAVFNRYFENLLDLEVEIRRRCWQELMTQLRRVAIESSGPEVLYTIASVYHRFAQEKRGLFQFAICSTRYAYEGSKFFDQFAYLIRMVLLSCEVDIRHCEQMATNLIDVIHGLALLQLDGRGQKFVSSSIDDLLKKYISQMFANLGGVSQPTQPA